MSIKKRVLSLVLCFIMVFSLLTVIPIAAVDTEAQAATTGTSVTVPNVWSARTGVAVGNTYGIFQKQDLNASIAILGPAKALSGGTIQYRYQLTDNLGGVNHTATGTNASAGFTGYAYGTNRTVTWTSSNTAAATIDGSGKVTTVGSGTTIRTHISPM